MANPVNSALAPIRVLLIEDDQTVVDAIRDHLAAEQFAVEHAADVAEGRERAKSRVHDIVVLDLGLPDGSGLDLASELRRSGNDRPILMLTARTTVEERVEGFAHGADDYLVKPFAVEELAARLHAVVRRTRSKQTHTIEYADIQLDLVRRTVHRGEIEAALSAREVDLLAYLMRHPEETLERDRILEDVWGDEAEEDSNVLNVYINYLRNKIERGIHPRIIHTVRRIGYMLSQKEPDERR